MEYCDKIFGAYIFGGTNMNDSTKEWMRKARDLGGIIAPFILAGSTVADIIDVADTYITYIKPIIIISALVTFIYAIYYFINGKKIRKKNKIIEEQIEDINILQKHISDGMKYYKNIASVIFDIRAEKYIIEIQKEYEIISDGIKWYQGQFYSNKILDNVIRSQEFYSDNFISWDDLDIGAELSYKNIEDSEESSICELAILKAAEGNNYKQFHIQYKTKDGNESLDIHKGAYIKLKYSYSIPIRLWGSYLNRYITYWGEYAEVYFKCKYKEKLNMQNFKLFKADDLTGEPKKIEIKEDKSDKIDSLHYYKIVLPKKKFTKYIVWWDANKIFGKNNLNTFLTADRSQLTQY